MSLDPKVTYAALLVVQTTHILHHRLAKRHIGFAEALSGVILCVPVTLAIPALIYNTAHVAMIVVQVIGSVWIERLSPNWETGGPASPENSKPT